MSKSCIVDVFVVCKGGIVLCLSGINCGSWDDCLDLNLMECCYNLRLFWVCMFM